MRSTASAGIFFIVALVGCGEIQEICPGEICNERCVATTIDIDNCGGCGIACNTAQTCTNSTCLSPALFAARPEIVQPNQTILLEGVFGPTAMVTFTGASPIPAVLLGSQRALATVPAEALTGDVTVTTRGVTTAPVRIRVTSFSTKLGAFRATYDQAGYAQQTPKLTQSRTGAIAMRSGRWMYLLGGSAAGVPVASIERALINADGSLGPFQVTGNLSVARTFASAIRLKDDLYILGGSTGASNIPVASIEHASIGSDGTLGSFMTKNESLTSPRSGHASVIIGRWIYVVGGGTTVERAPVSTTDIGAFELVSNSLTVARSKAAIEVTGRKLVVIGGEEATTLSTIEEASISDDGDIGPFTLSSIGLASPRSAAASVVIDDSLYLIGGNNGLQDLSSVDRTPIAEDGSLSGFSSISDLSIPRRGLSLQVVDNWVYVLGGTASASLERASIIGSHRLGSPGAAFDTTGGPGRGMFTAGDYLFHISGNRNSPENGVQRAALTPQSDELAFIPLQITGVTPARNNPSIAITTSDIYVMGGTTNSGVLTSVTKATISQNGAIGNFSNTGTPLITPRNGAVALVISDNLYVIGGDNNGDSRSIERSQITTDGTLSNFIQLTIQLITARTLATGIVLGDKVFVIGGQSAGNSLSTIEVASILDGNIGQFVMSTLALQTARYSPASIVIGDKVYIFGGFNASGYVTSVEVATIERDNTLGPFSTVSGISGGDGGGVQIQNTVIVGPPARPVRIIP